MATSPPPQIDEVPWIRVGICLYLAAFALFVAWPLAERWLATGSAP